MIAKTDYRPDIDGLRALAVLSVIAYHYGADWLPGGFTGVDIFFVISGYLITRIVKSEMETGRFSFFDFYRRRILRILPAVLVVMLATTAASWFILFPTDYAIAAKNAIYATFGLGNLFSYLHTGYFDQQAELQPLLHLWSLGVEEQFYLIWPFGLMALLGISSSRTRFAVLAILVGIGLGVAAFQVSKQPSAAFYLPVSRAWELALGALVCIAPSIGTVFLSRAAQLVGSLLIVAGWSFVQSDDPFPGLNALFPCLGAALLIWPKKSTRVADWLSLKPLVAIGLVSFSLYLWHWPVLVLFRHINNTTHPHGVTAALLLLLTAALAGLSWRYIETPFRKAQFSFGVRSKVAIVACLVTASLSMWAIIVHQKGIAFRLPEDALLIADKSAMWAWDGCRLTQIQNVPDFCSFGALWSSDAPKVFIWGDSHAEHYAPLLETALNQQEKPVSVGLFPPGCPPIYTASIRRDDAFLQNACPPLTKPMIDFLKRSDDIQVVVFAAFWSNIPNRSYLSSTGEPLPFATIWEEMAKVIQDIGSGKSYYILTDVPSHTDDPAACVASSASGLWRFPCEIENVNSEEFKTREALTSLLASPVGKYALLAGESLCSSFECVQEIEGSFLYRDVNHLRRDLPTDVRYSLVKIMHLNDIFDSGAWSVP
tara:strand:- start:1857 stop:3821 length:1965 start_codon:yes stop_codon:yes gene_type:complete